MSTVLKTIKSRRSIRKFKKTIIEKKKIDAILEAGRWAPSLANTQPWKFIVVRDAPLREDLVVATGHESIAQAPVVFVVLVDPSVDSIHYIESGAIATQNMSLAAKSLGLGSFWIGVFNTSVEDKIKSILEIPESQRVISILPVGYPAESPKKERKALQELVYQDKYGKINT